jgi:hypothetical protein
VDLGATVRLQWLPSSNTSMLNVTPFSQQAYVPGALSTTVTMPTSGDEVAMVWLNGATPQPLGIARILVSNIPQDGNKFYLLISADSAGTIITDQFPLYRIATSDSSVVQPAVVDLAFGTQGLSVFGMKSGVLYNGCYLWLSPTPTYSSSYWATDVRGPVTLQVFYFP